MSFELTQQSQVHLTLKYQTAELMALRKRRRLATLVRRYGIHQSSISTTFAS